MLCFCNMAFGEMSTAITRSADEWNEAQQAIETSSTYLLSVAKPKR
ncbi:MAG: hypothetical protein ACK5QX_03710 [bacterium]